MNNIIHFQIRITPEKDNRLREMVFKMCQAGNRTSINKEVNKAIDKHLAEFEKGK